MAPREKNRYKQLTLIISILEIKKKKRGLGNYTVVNDKAIWVIAVTQF